MLDQGENDSYLSAFELKPTRAFDFLNAKDLKVRVRVLLPRKIPRRSKTAKFRRRQTTTAAALYIYISFFYSFHLNPCIYSTLVVDSCRTLSFLVLDQPKIVHPADGSTLPSLPASTLPQSNNITVYDYR